MKQKIRRCLIKYGSCALAVAGLAWLYLGQRDLAGATKQEQYRMWCDAFTIPGVILVMLGGMVWASTQGALDGLAFCLRYAALSLIPGRQTAREEKYADYLERKQKNRAKGYGFLFISGLITMAVAVVFLALYYSV